jgi:hypothetical protein
VPISVLRGVGNRVDDLNDTALERRIRLNANSAVSERHSCRLTGIAHLSIHDSERLSRALIRVHIVGERINGDSAIAPLRLQGISDRDGHGPGRTNDGHPNRARNLKFVPA